MDSKEYQKTSCHKLKQIFGNENVKQEWDVGKSSQDSLTREIYCPRLDIAVGPFNIDGRVEYNKQRIKDSIHRYSEFLRLIIDVSENGLHSKNNILTSLNRNPRCFLQLRLNASGSRKHMLGDIANASILGAIGIVIPLTPSKLKGFTRIMKYIEFATAVGKLKSSFKNVLLINSDKFLEVLSHSDFLGMLD
ncbi:MAG: hypothetical protein P9X22_02260 [Candidatus Zapsychrus exili]|nr:hypothetical protein [Candidatus Zapsychrus exili]